MNENESPIHSMNVSLGAPRSMPGESKQALQPWVVLICADLGYVSRAPELLSAATLNDLFATHDVVIAGTVENGLPDDIAPFHIEYRPRDIGDFSVAALSAKLPLLNRLKNASSILEAITAKKIDPTAGLQQIMAMDLPQSIIRRLGAEVPTSAAGSATSASPHKAAAVDSILSMVDFGEPEEVAAAPVASSPTDLAALLTEGGKGAYSTAGIIACKENIDALITSLGALVMAQPFFKAAYGSWSALRALLKAAGRNRTLRFLVHSAPFDAAQRHFYDALQSSALAAAIPDMVIWDYAVTTDTAAMQQLEHIGTIADQYKTMVVTSLYRNDPLYIKIAANEPLQQVVDKPEYIPLRRLQQSPVSRCLALCAPDASIIRASGVTDAVFTGAWLCVLQWVTSVVENSAPFHLQNSSSMALDTFAFPKLTKETVFDAYRCGVTVLRPGSVTVPRVLLGDADSPYGSMLFNVCVNRTARLSADWIGAQDKHMSAAQAAPALEKYLAAELEPYGILTSGDEVQVSTDGQNLSITVNSSVAIAGFRAAFDFSFNFRE